MIYGAKYWDDRSRFSIQTNNPTEEQLRKAGVDGWLETCGPTAAINCLGAVDVNLVISCPGPYRPQPEEVLADYLNDPANYPTLMEYRHDVDPSKMQNNRVPQDYPIAVREVFGATAEFSWGSGFDTIVADLKRGCAVQVALKKPGHYLALVAYDSSSDEIIFDDSWPARVGGDGFNRRVSRSEFTASIQSFRIVYAAA